MPLTRYQIRDEYSLADPELYRAADRDDPEALLEGVAMAGLVGVLRQLGDLAEFAAEIFHDLHEEVMATAARGHGLMVRVQQLEAEVPSIEKAFLSQTNHSLFFSNSGNDWHPNLHMEQNLITQGDLPRFVMDSYEECRGPPRLFLLDKFDVAGAGACLKRYTDPSFFKVEAASSGMTTAEVQREKKNRKAKKKGSRWRNGETPEFHPPSHAKLHQLFLEERIENGFSNPAHVVKLKRRQLNGSLFVSKEGKSYMEKFLESSSPKQKVVHEISVGSPMKSNVDNSSESGLEILEIRTVSPGKKSPQRKESSCSSPNAQDLISKLYTDKFSSDAAGREIVKVPEPANGCDADYISPPSLLNREVEEEVAVDGEMKTEGSADGYHSDDLTSEIDNYMDALATMESEVETENEYRTKNKNGFLTVKKHGRDSDGNEEKLEQRARFSDSQSFGNSSASDYGNSSFKNYRPSFSDSDTLSSLAENTAPGIDRAAEVCPSTDTSAAENVAMPSSQLRDEPMQIKYELIESNGTCIEEGKIPDLGEASCNSCLTDSKPMLLPLDHGVHTALDRLHGPEIDEAAIKSNKLGSKLSETDKIGEDLAYSRVVASDDPSQTLDDVQLIGSAESHLDLKDPNVVSDVLLHLPDISDPTPENRSDNFLKEVLQTESADEDYSENLVDGKTGSPHSSTLPTGKAFLQSVLPEEEANSDVMPTTSDVVDPDGIVSKADDALIANGINSEDLTPVVETQKTHNVEEQQLSELANNVSEVELDSADLDLPCSDDKRDVDEIPRAAYGMETQKTHNVEEQKLKRPIEGMPIPTCSDAVDQDGVVSKADDALIANGINSEDLTPVVQTQKTHNVEEQQLSELAKNVSEVELDSSDLGLPCSDDKRDVDEIPRAAYGMEIGKSNCLDAVRGDAVPLECPSNCQNYSCREDHVNLDAVVTEPVKADVSPSSAAVTSTNDDVNDVFCTSPDLACSSSGNHANVQVYSGFATSDVKGMEFVGGISVECLAETEALKQVNQPEVAPADSAYRPVSSDLSNSRTLDNDLELSPPKQTQNNLCDHDVAISPTYSGLRNQQPESESLCGSHLLQNSRDEVSPASSYLLETGSTSEKLLQFEADQAAMKSFQEDEAAFNSTKLHSEQILSLNHEDQETCEKIQSSNHLQEICFRAPELHSEHLPCQPSAAGLLPQSVGLELDGSKQAIDPLEPALLGFGLPPKATQVNLEEMPPLPPLPPMQWRMGKAQNTSPASQRDLVEASEHAFPPLQPLVDEKAQFGFPAIETGILLHQHPFLPIMAVEDGKSQQVSGKLVSNSVQPIPFSLEVPTVVSDSDSQYNCLSLEGKETMNPFLTSPAKLDERPEYGSLSWVEEKAQPSSIPFSPTPIIEHTNPRHDFESSQDKLIEPINQLGPETMLGDKTLRSTEQNYSEVGWQNPFDTSLQPPTMEADQSQHASMASDGETPQVPGLVQRLNGNPPKLPRPRNPLIDAVAAHDKSKLRKVADRVRPHNGPKGDERDSLLEQIRTKSFNLKPAMMTRPSIHGPKTNLKVAAILEKAKTIRQAFAGSDEDNDSDSWSDA